jgi:hypothetical protein
MKAQPLQVLLGEDSGVDARLLREKCSVRKHGDVSYSRTGKTRVNGRPLSRLGAY